MFLEILTPEKKVFEGEVSIATFPGADGSFQILNDHAPLISTLKGGTIEFKNSKGAHEVKVNGGVVEVLNNRIVVLADSLIEE
jgi:F-type H+-transporting ATPase subunit epsilon